MSIRLSKPVPAQPLSRLVTRLAASTPAGAVALVVLCLLVYLPGLWTLPPVDRDESRFAQASRQMFESVALPPEARDPALHSGGLVVPMLTREPRLNKPPMIYWLQSASAALVTLGEPMKDRIWHYRLPSLLGAIVSVLVTWRLGAQMAGRRVGLLAGAVLAVCPVLAWESHQARADVVLLAFTTMAMGSLWSIWIGARRGPLAPIMFWVSLAGAILTKGPVAPMIAALTVVTVSMLGRDWRWLWRARPVMGAVILLLTITPWVLAVAARVGLSEYLDLVLNETLGRGTQSREGHWGPPGYHAALLPALFWPGCLLSIIAVWHAIKSCVRQARRDKATRARPPGPGERVGVFLLAWLLPAWILFELYATKLPHYTLPLSPAIAILSARAAISATRHKWAGPRMPIAWVGHATWLAIGLVLVALPVVAAFTLIDADGPDGRVRAAAAAVSGLALVTLVAASLSLARARFASAIVLGAIAMALSAATLIGLVLPRSGHIWTSSLVIGATPAESRARFAVSGYSEDSIVFLTRARVTLVHPDSALGWMREHPGSPIWINASQFSPETLSSIEALAGPATAKITGFNYSKGREETLSLYHGDP